MNILFLTLAKLTSIKDTMVYTDMLHTFEKYGHTVYAICPLEKRDNRDNYLENVGNIYLLHANIGGNYFNVNSLEKGITLLRLEKGSNIRFDLVFANGHPARPAGP